MKIKLFIFFTALSAFFASCNSEDKIYRSINLETYNKYKPIYTLYNTKSYLATVCKDTFTRIKATTILIKKPAGADFNYFLLEPDTYFENDSVIINYSPPLISDSENGEFQKNGLWFYARFYDNDAGKGVNFSVDSVPAGKQKHEWPRKEGIYFYKNNFLGRVSREQSEDAFYAYKKDGFYFLPNKGRFFKRYSINSIK